MGTPIGGNNTIVKFTGITPSVVSVATVSGDTTTISLNDTYATQSAAHRGNTAATVPGEHTVEITVGFIGTSESTAIYKLAQLRPTPTGTTGTLLIQWEGATTGSPAESLVALVTGRTVNSAVNGLVDGEYTFAAQGEITYGAVA
jgi:hypothetical protein